jgi:hypothetical protein
VAGKPVLQDYPHITAADAYPEEIAMTIRANNEVP